jgi:hypothetical protein
MIEHRNAIAMALAAAAICAAGSRGYMFAAVAQEVTPSSAANAIAYDEIEASVPATLVPSPDDFDAMVSSALHTRDAKVATTGGQGATVGGGGSIAACNGPFDFGRSKVLVNPPGVPFYVEGGTQGRFNYRPDSREIAVMRHAYMGNAERDDDLISGFSVIRDGDRHRWVLLDVFRREYFIVPIGTPSPRAPSGSGGPASADVERVETSTHVERLEDRRIGGRETEAYAVSKRVTLHLTAGTVQQRDTDFVVYLSTIRMPVPPCPQNERSRTYRLPEELALIHGAESLGETQAPVRTEHDGPDVPADRLLLYVAERGDPNRRARYAHVVMRGHVRSLRSDAKGPFEIPSDYTQLTREPPHSMFEAKQRFAALPTAPP